MARKVIDYLNEKSGRNFRHAQADLRFVTARLNEGFALDELKLIIDFKVYEWLNNPEMSQYLRPATLFGTKANSYLATAQACSAQSGVNNATTIVSSEYQPPGMLPGMED